MESGRQPDSIARDFNGADVNGKPYIGDDAEDTLQRIKTSGTGSVTISSDLFEKLYLQPKISGPQGLKHPLQKILGNPTGLSIIGFEMSLMPITMQLMEWRGAAGSNTTNNANVIFFGGVLMWLGGILEFILGNTFPFLVFTAFGSFYAGYGSTLIPWFATYAPFSDDPVNAAADGLTTMGFNASYGHFWAAFTILMFFFFLCSLRTNLVYAYMFATILAGVACITAIYYHVANGDTDAAHDCQIAAGALLFSTCVVGWYLFAALIFPSVDFPLPIPLGDLQEVVPSLSSISSGKKGWSAFRRKQRHDEVEDAV